MSINNRIKIDENEKINDGFLEECVKQQNDFCDNPNKYLNPDYEDLITLTNFDFKNLSYQLYVYKKNDKYMSNEIIRTAKYEPGPMFQFLEALQYYDKTKNIFNNKEIFMLDIGGNIGVHTSFFRKAWIFSYYI